MTGHEQGVRMQKFLYPEVENLTETPRKGLKLRGRGVLDVHPYIQLTFVPRREGLREGEGR